MMGVRNILDKILRQRARGIASKLELSGMAGQRILDVGSGTGHNAQELRQRHRCTIIQADVVDMHLTGEQPQLFDGEWLPYADHSFDTSLMIYVLQYVDEPERLLREAARVTSGEVMILQTVYHGKPGRLLLNVHEYITGILPFRFCRMLGLLKGVSTSLRPEAQYSHRQLQQLFKTAGLKVTGISRTVMIPYFIYHYTYKLRTHG